MKFKFKVKKRTKTLGNIVAGFMFIMLAIYGWDLPVMTALLYLAICVSFLVLIVAFAALFGWILVKLRSEKIQDNLEQQDATSGDSDV